MKKTSPIWAAAPMMHLLRGGAYRNPRPSWVNGRGEGVDPRSSGWPASRCSGTSSWRLHGSQGERLAPCPIGKPSLPLASPP